MSLVDALGLADPTGVCLVDGCDKPAHGRGLCRPHYMRWWRYGDPLGAAQPPPRGREHWNSRSLAARFWSKVDFSTPDACWPWKGSLRHNYGELWVNGRKMYAHRAAYALVHGPAPNGLEVCHHCDNPLCVRPDHLFLGTHADNLADMRAKGRGSEPPRRRANTTQPSRMRDGGGDRGVAG